MHRVTRAPLGVEERSLLQKLSRLSLNNDFGGAITFLIVMGVLGSALGYGLVSILPRTVALTIAAGSTMALWAYLSYANLRTRLAEKQRFRRDLTSGETEVIEIQGAVVVRQADQDEDDPLYYFILDDQKVLFLGGQGLYDVDPFPTRDLAIRRAPVSKLVFRIEPRGPAIASDRTISRSAVEVAEFGVCELLDLGNPALAPVRGACTSPSS